jgi:hypothetical protein
MKADNRTHNPAVGGRKRSPATISSWRLGLAARQNSSVLLKLATCATPVAVESAQRQTNNGIGACAWPAGALVGEAWMPISIRIIAGKRIRVRNGNPSC